MSPWEIATALFDEPIRVEKIIWLSGNTGDQNDDFKEFFEEENFDKIAKLLNVKRKQLEDVVNEHDMEELSSWLCRQNKYGFLVQVATPVVHDFNSTGTSYSWSWGCAWLEWFYTEQFDTEFVESLIAWAEGMRKKVRLAEKKKKKS